MSPTIFGLILFGLFFVAAIWLAARYIHMQRTKRPHEPLRVWIYSGVRRGPMGTRTDSGFIRVPALMTQSEALKMLPTIIPAANVVHVDAEHGIITYEI